MKEGLRKTLGYFRLVEDYWQSTNYNQPLAVEPGVVGRYPLNLIARLEQGHYNRFDTQGLPVRLSDDGHIYYNYTTLCSYALAHWERYLVIGNQDDASRLLQVADYITQNAIHAPDGSLLLADDRKQGALQLSAINQGEAMSVLIRAWKYTGHRPYRDAACQCMIPFTKKIENQGVKHVFRGDENIPWYEEYACYPLRHVLNGMIYALWGLDDVLVATDDELAKELFDQGVHSVSAALPYFDTGKWSYYSISDLGINHQIASMMYHNLHIVQLQELYGKTKREIFRVAATRFDRYSQRASMRFWAGFMLFMNKINRRVLPLIGRN